MLRHLLVTLALLALPLSAVDAVGSGETRIQVVDERGRPVRDAVVEIDSPRTGAGRITFPWRMAMAQRDEAFVPGTLIIARGSTVAFPNLDRVRHSIYSFSRAARFEIDLYGRDQTRTHTFPAAGTVALGCNIHDDMRGYIRVVTTPHAAKTDHNGIARIGGVPSGNATVTIWHPRLRAPGGEMSRTLAISGTTSRRIPVRLR